jgi:predicted PurR-regulated permease PerM
MALPVRDQVKYWGVAGVVLLLVLWQLGNVILPFIVGGAIAYFMDPVADRLEKAGLSRAAATGTISIIALLVAILIMLSIVPTLVKQLTSLVNDAPEIFRRLQSFLLQRFPELQDETSTMRQTLENIGMVIQSRGGELVNTVIGSAISVISAVVFIVVVPVVAFYLLLDWDHMVKRVDDALPRDHAPVIRRLASEIDGVLAAFVRGQISVCIVLGVFYSVALMLAGLDYALVVGAIAGGVTFIPYVGALVGGALAIGLALFQFWGDPVSIAIVAGIFAIGQFLEGNVITPRLVGNSVGLHPVWLLFALSAFGTLFGFVGMLVAVPVAAAIGVLARFGIERYKSSRLYTGLATQAASDDPEAPDA